MTPASVRMVTGTWRKPEHFRPLVEDLRDLDVRTVALADILKITEVP